MTERDCFRVGTWNMHHGAPEDKYWVRPWLVERALKQIDNLGLDILALQEVGRRNLFSGFVDLGAKVLNRAGMKAVFEPTMRFYQGGLYGNALLVRGSIYNVNVLHMGGDYRYGFKFKGRNLKGIPEPRNAITATANVRGQDFLVAATHLGGLLATRRDQFALTRSYLEEERERQLGLMDSSSEELLLPSIILGDFNTGWETVQKWLNTPGNTLSLAERQPTNPASDPKRSINHILTNGLEVKNVRPIPLGTSDHCLLETEVYLAEAA